MNSEASEQIENQQLSKNTPESLQIQEYIALSQMKICDDSFVSVRFNQSVQMSQFQPLKQQDGTQKLSHLMQDEQVQDQQIIKPKINIRQVAMRLGGGAFGTVEELIDFQSFEIVAKKSFSQIAYFQEEKKIYEKILQDFKSSTYKLENVAILPKSISIPEQAIYFTPGRCSLAELCNIQDFKITDNQIVHVFIQLLDFILLMYEKKLFHSDLKPANITLVPVEQKIDYYIAKVIDFGSVTSDTFGYQQYTPEFFNNPNRKSELSSGKLIFNNLEERLKNEFYTIIRTTQSLLLGKQGQNAFQLCQIADSDKRLEQLLKIQQIINERYKNEMISNQQFSTILNFINDQGIKENYCINQLIELLEKLKSGISQQPQSDFQINDQSTSLYPYFYDSQHIVAQIAAAKRKQQESRESVISLLFGLNSYVALNGSFLGDYSDEHFNLLDKVKQRVLDTSSAAQTTILIGEGGAGKTLLLLKLLIELNNDQRFEQVQIIHFKLRELSGMDDSKEQLLKLTNHIEKTRIDENNPILLLLDGFDELNNKNIRIKADLQNKFHPQKIQIVVTSRPRFASDADFFNCFGQNTVLFVCPFNQTQRDEFINNSVKSFNKLKHSAIVEFETFDTGQEYIDMLNKYESLNSLAKVPFSLLVLVTILPNLKQKQNQKNSSDFLPFTRYQIYELFTQQYMQNELKRAVCIDEFKQGLCEHYQYDDKINFQIQDEEIMTDFKLINKLISWKMLAKLNLQLSLSDIKEVVEYADRTYAKQLHKVYQILCYISPLDRSSDVVLAYSHKSLYEFYISQSIVEEALNLNFQCVDENTTMLKLAYIAFDLDILRMVGEHLMEIPIELQYLKFFEVWYRSVLLSRKITSLQDDSVQCILKITSNSINLMGSLPYCNFTGRDFADCSIHYAYLYKKDLSGCNFTQASLFECEVTDSRLDNCLFNKSDLRRLKLGRYPDLLSHQSSVNCVAYSPDGKLIVSGSGTFDYYKNTYDNNDVKVWDSVTMKERITLKSHSKTVTSLAFSNDSRLLATGDYDCTIKLWDVATMNELITLQNHPIPVRAIAFSPDGTLLASAGGDSTRDSDRTYAHELSRQKKYQKNCEEELQRTDKKLQKFRDQKIWGDSEQDRTQASLDNAIKIWNLSNKQVIVVLQGHCRIVNTIAFSIDGKMLASGSNDDTIKLWDLATMRECKTLTHPKTRFMWCSIEGEPSSAVNSVAFSPDGKLLASGSDDNTVKLWDLATMKEIGVLKGHTQSVESVAFSKNGDYIASGSTDKNIKLWDACTYKEITTYSGHSARVKSVAFSPDDKILASGSCDQSIKMWNLAAIREIISLPKGQYSVDNVAFSVDGKYLASTSSENFITVYDLSTMKQLRRLPKLSITDISKQQQSSSSAVVVNVNQQTTEKDNSQELSTDQFFITYFKGYADGKIAFSRDSKLLAFLQQSSYCYSDQIQLWDLATINQLNKQELRYYPRESIKCGSINTLDISKDGKLIATGNNHNKVQVWDLSTTKLIATLEGHADQINTVVFSHDGKFLATAGGFPGDFERGSDDNRVKVWSVTSMQEIGTLQGHRNYVSQVVFSTDDKILASASEDCTIKLWKLSTMQELVTLLGHSDGVRSVGFSNDGKFLASGSSDKTIKIWWLQSFIGAEQIEKEHFIENTEKALFPYKPFDLVTLGGTGSTFSCNNTIFDNCTFEDEQESERFAKVCEKYGSRKIANPNYQKVAPFN